MIPHRPQANDNHRPEAVCGVQIDQVKRRFVAKLARTVRETPEANGKGGGPATVSPPSQPLSRRR